MALTKAELEAPINTTLSGIDTVLGTDFPSAAPASADSVSVTANATAKTVAQQAVASQNAGIKPTVDYTKISTSDEITVDTLNKPAETLKAAVNGALDDLHKAVNTALVGVSGDTKSAIDGLVGDINNKFATLKGEQDTLSGDINTQFSDLITDINAAFSAIRTAEQDQSNAIAGKLNTVSAQANAQDLVLKKAIEDVLAKVVALDDVYGTDSEIANKIAGVNALIETLKETDLDFVAGVKSTVAEINMLERFKSKEFLIAATSGVYNVNLLGEGFPEAILSSDYRATVTAIDNIKVECEIINKTKDGFDIKIMSKGVHFVPQPVDCSVTPLKVNVVVYNEKKNTLTFNVDTLNSSFVTSGAGTDANAI